MKHIKVKILLLLLFFIFAAFFSNDFSLIDIEKTAIITALGIDGEDGAYEVTAQIAVPEATDVNSESKHAQLTGKGSTVGAAIKNIGDISGWYPHLSFCNLIIIGKSFENTNFLKTLDYFAKTLRVQDSALIVLADSKASDVLNKSTALDSISSFAIQKILFKNTGFDTDVVSSDIKTFCKDYYSVTHSSYMPIIKEKKDGEDGGESGGGGSDMSGGSGGSSSSGSSGEQSSQKTVFVASETALFLSGKKVGVLNGEETATLASIITNVRGTTIQLKDVKNGLEKPRNYLLTVFRNLPNITVRATENELKVIITLNIYCKISDQNAEYSDSTYAKNIPLPFFVQEAATEQIKVNIEKLIEIEKTTGCDFLKIKQKLYRMNYKHFARYKDNFLSEMKTEVIVNLSGQK